MSLHELACVATHHEWHVLDEGGGLREDVCHRCGQTRLVAVHPKAINYVMVPGPDGTLKKAPGSEQYVW